MIDSLRASMQASSPRKTWGFWLAGSLVVLWLLAGLFLNLYGQFTKDPGAWVALGVVLAAGVGIALGSHLYPLRRRLGGLLFASGLLTLVGPGVFFGLVAGAAPDWLVLVVFFLTLLAIGALLVLLPLGIITALLGRPIPQKVAEIVEAERGASGRTTAAVESPAALLPQLEERFQDASRAAREALTTAEQELADRQGRLQRVQRRLQRIESEKEELTRLLAELKVAAERMRYPLKQHLISFLFGVAGSIVAAWIASRLPSLLAG